MPAALDDLVLVLPHLPPLQGLAVHQTHPAVVGPGQQPAAAGRVLHGSALVVVGVDGAPGLESPQAVDAAGAVEVGSHESVIVCRERGDG